jgi:type I restriction enzyme, S subunit
MVTPMTLKAAIGPGGLIIDGDWVESKDQNPAGDVRLIQLADIGDGTYLNKSARFLTSTKARQLRCTMLRPGDVLISRMADPIGRACIFPGDPKQCVTVVDICVARSDGHFVTPHWLKYAINEPRFRATVLSRAVGATRPRISGKNLQAMTVNVPSIDEQNQVVDLLSRAENIVRMRREAEQKAKEMIPALFLDLFGDPGTNSKQWPIGFLGDLLALPIRNGISPSNSGTHVGRVLTLSAITRGRFDVSAVKTANFASPLDAMDEVQKSDFLICRGNGNRLLVGTGCFALSDMRGVAFPDTAIAVRPHPDKLQPHFLEALWKTGFVRSQIEQIAKTTNGTYKINQAGLASIRVIVPELAVQNRFAAAASAIGLMQDRMNIASKWAQEAFEALLSRAFTVTGTP